MKWRLVMGNDTKSDLFARVFFRFMMILTLAAFFFLLAPEMKDPDGNKILLIISVMSFGLVILIWDFPLTAYCIDGEGICIRSLFWRRRIKLSQIRTVRIYMLYVKGVEVGKYLFCIRDPNKKMPKLGLDLFILYNPNYLVFKITDERLKEFKEYCPIPIELGRQDGKKCLD